MIPLREIVGIAKAAVVKSVKETLPNIVPLANVQEKVLNDHLVLEVYTIDGKVRNIE